MEIRGIGDHRHPVEALMTQNREVVITRKDATENIGEAVLTVMDYILHEGDFEIDIRKTNVVHPGVILDRVQMMIIGKRRLEPSDICQRCRHTMEDQIGIVSASNTLKLHMRKNGQVRRNIQTCFIF